MDKIDIYTYSKHGRSKRQQWICPKCKRITYKKEKCCKEGKKRKR